MSSSPPPSRIFSGSRGPASGCHAVFVLGALVSALALAGCTEEKKNDTTNADAGAEQGPQKPVLGGKLAAAVKAAESAQPAQKATDGPPENGVFAPGAADKAVAPNAPLKVEVINEGKAPGFTFTFAPAAEQRELASITVRLQNASIPVEYGLALKIDKPKDEKKDAPAGTFRVLGKVAAIGVPPQAPRELSDKLGKLKGTELKYTLSAAAGATELAYAIPKDADPGFADLVVKGLLDATVLAMPPLPSKPVGVGGFWMVSDRSSAFGIETVRYRVYTVDKIEGGAVSLSLQVRQYATKEEADLGAQKLVLQQFDGTGTSKIDWSPAALLPLKAETSLKTRLAGNVGQGQQAGLQAELVGRFQVETAEKKK